MSQDVYIKGFNKSHGFIVATTKVDETVLNFTLGNNESNIRDILIENIGSNDVFMRFSKTEVSSVDISTGATKVTEFLGDSSYGWALAPNRPLSLSYCDYTNIGLICNTGETSVVQIMGILDTDNNNNN